MLLLQESSHSCFLRTSDSVPYCIRSRLVPCISHHSLVSSFNRSDAHNERDSMEGCGPVGRGVAQQKRCETQ